MPSISTDILYFVSGMGIIQGFLLSTLIYFHPRSDRSVNIFLALHIFAASAVMTLPFMLKLVGWQNSFFIQPIPFLPGPLLYLYLRSFREKITWKKALPHFIIFFLFFFAAYGNLAALSVKYPKAEDVPPEALRKPLTIVLMIIRVLQPIFYYFMARRILLSYQRSIRDLYSETSRINLNWARFLINGYLILNSIFIVTFPLMVRFPEQFNILLLINMSIGAPYIYAATYKGITQPTIWQLQPTVTKESVEVKMQEVEEMAARPDHREARPIKAGLPDSRIDQIAKRVVALMEQEKLYQEPELTLQQLAEKLQLPSYQVSQAVNEGLDKNFYDLVNGFRVEEAKRLLLDAKNRNFTILSVGFEAGFNSKTTFNTVFKKFTGQTPTEFREKEKNAYAPG